MHAARLLPLLFLLVFIVPLATHAAWWSIQGNAEDWRRADWSSAKLLPAASTEPEATVHVFAARVGRWRGVFAHHSWVVVKEAGASAYTRFDVVGWGTPVRVNHREADGRWYGNLPEPVAEIRGAAAEALIPRIRAAVKSYAYVTPGSYQAWPGPNSNSFVQHVMAEVPELARALPPTAIGKDFREDGLFAGLTPSRTGIQASLYGLAGFTAGAGRRPRSAQPGAEAAGLGSRRGLGRNVILGRSEAQTRESHAEMLESSPEHDVYRPHTASSACARSEIRSSMFSMPTEMRISASVSPISSRSSLATPECVIAAGCETSVSVPPSETASFMIWRLSSSAKASFSPPTTSKAKVEPAAVH